MKVKLISYGCLGMRPTAHPQQVVIVEIPGVQVCYLDRYEKELARVARLHGATDFEVWDHGYVHSGKIKDSRLILSDR